MGALEDLLKQSPLVKELESFAEKLRHESLFFTRSPMIEDCIKKYSENLSGEISKGMKLWRVRKHEGKGPPRKLYTRKEILNPPVMKAREGRLNPAGISFLYLANTLETAVLETGCRAGDFVTAAQFRAKDKLSYFTLIKTDEIREDMTEDERYFFDRLDEMIGMPIDNISDPSSYRVTQWFGEFIKNIGFQCLVVESAT